jgi:SAM-dependent methyltransferase
MTTHDAPHEPHGDIAFTPEFWDDRYRSADRLWSGRPNDQLVAQASDLPPGDALDVGSGEGADAIWLASRGWTVTAVDVSAVALERGARQAVAGGEQIAARISWQQADMLTWEPGRERFDLVSAQFMYLPPPAFEQMRARLAAAVRPGGTLLVVGHHPDDLHARGATVADMAWTAEELAAALEPASWDILVATAISRQAADPDGQPVRLTDTVLRAVRRR